MEIDYSRMYRVSAVARLLDVSPSTVYRAIESGALAALRIGSTVRVHGSALADWLAWYPEGSRVQSRLRPDLHGTVMRAKGQWLWVRWDNDVTFLDDEDGVEINDVQVSPLPAPAEQTFAMTGGPTVAAVAGAAGREV